MNHRLLAADRRPRSSMSRGRARLRRALISSGRPSDHQAAVAIPETSGCRRTSTPTIVAAVAEASFVCTKADQGSTESRPTIPVHGLNSRPKTWRCPLPMNPSPGARSLARLAVRPTSALEGLTRRGNPDRLSGLKSALQPRKVQGRKARQNSKESSHEPPSQLAGNQQDLRRGFMGREQVRKEKGALHERF